MPPPPYTPTFAPDTIQTAKERFLIPLMKMPKKQTILFLNALLEKNFHMICRALKANDVKMILMSALRVLRFATMALVTTELVLFTAFVIHLTREGNFVIH